MKRSEYKSVEDRLYGGIKPYNKKYDKDLDMSKYKQQNNDDIIKELKDKN